MRTLLLLLIALLVGLNAPAPLSAASAGTFPAGRVGCLGPMLQPFVARDLLAGAVGLVATAERVIALEAVGFSDLTSHKAMPQDALFWIASQSKPMTATALMILVDAGRLQVDDPVERYLPEFRGQMVAVERDSQHVLLRKPAHPITIRELLCHTSGLPFASPMEEPTLDRLSLRDAVRSYAMLPLLFEPGTKYEYSNAGINTIGRIIEVVGGMPYEQFMEERLFKPLGMKDTTFWPTTRQLNRLAKSYRPNADHTGLEETVITQLAYPLQDRKRQPMPAGGLFSTARDVARFCQMILQGGFLDGRRYLAQALVAEMTSKQTGDLVKDGYGLGWSMHGSSYGHGGGYGTSMSIDPQRQVIAVLLVQQAGFAGAEGSALEKAFTEGVHQCFGTAP
jgi:CubicO group peptidase (beta-lactamase class C family)